MQRLTRWFPFLGWPRPDAALLRNELAAGLTVALVMVPQCVAYAGLAGMPLVTGLYAALLPPLVAVLFGSSTRVSVGPAALTCILTAASLTPLAEPGTAQWVLLAVWLALLSGLVQLGMGMGRLAWLLNLVSAPVLLGFTQAAALLIMAAQLPAFLGVKDSLASLWEQPRLEAEALAYGVAALALLVLGKRLAPRLPMVLLVVGGGAAASAATGFAQRHPVIGALPSGLPVPYWPSWPGWQALLSLLAPALVIALVSFMETASSAKIEAQRDGKRWDDDQDMLAQGLAKLASAFSGSFPTSTSLSRSAMTWYAGARSGWSAVATVLCVLLALQATPLLYHVPLSVLAAVVIAAVAGLLKPRAVATLWGIDRFEATICAATFVVTLLSSPRIYWGVITGVLMVLAHYLHHRLHPRIIEVGLHPDGSLRDRLLWQLPRLAPDVYALRMDADLDFASASDFEHAVGEHLAHPGAQAVRQVCLFAHTINRVDATGAEVFGQVRKLLEERGVALHVSGLKLPAERVLRKAGVLEPGPLLFLYRTDVEALQAFGRTGVVPQPGEPSPSISTAKILAEPPDTRTR